MVEPKDKLKYYSGGNLDYFEQIALGNVLGKELIYKFGRASGIDAGDLEVDIVEGIKNYVLPDTNGTLSIVSDSASDAVGQGGATEITCVGLYDDGLGNWLRRTKSYTLTGLTPVVVSDDFIRVNRSFISKGENRSQKNGANQGNITVTHSATTLPISYISQYRGQTLQAVYTIPSGYTGLIYDADTLTGKGSDAEATLKSRHNIEGTEVFRVKGTREMYQNEVGQEFKIPVREIEKTDLVFNCSTTVTGGNTANVSGTLQLILVNNKIHGL